MTQLVLTSADEALLDAASVALVTLGVDCSIGLSKDFLDDGPYFTFAAQVPGTEEYASGGGKSISVAAQKFIYKANEIIANPPPVLLRTPAKVKEAVLELVEEYRGPGSVALDELADRIAAIAVKE